MTQHMKTRLLAIPALVLTTVGAAHAAVPAAVNTAIGEAGTDLVTVATAVITALVGFWALAKIGKKMGWW